jgi:hypothetical protein
MSNPTELNGTFSTSSLTNSIHNLYKLANREEAYVLITYHPKYGWSVRFSPDSGFFNSNYVENDSLIRAIDKIISERDKENGQT